jgi:putative transposase
MHGRGRTFDNIFVEGLWRTVKYEDVYLKGYANMGELMLGLMEYFMFYNDERPHRALANETPETVYRTRQGGGALIVDKYSPAAIPIGEHAVPGQRCSAASEAQDIA